MSQENRGPEKDGSRPKTAVEEVLQEVEEAETDPRENDGRDGEAADALSPSRSAQEDARRRASGAEPGNG
ncbi:hypothetical protein GCM10010275_40210 [Streptomyces litmocidini]|uniref:hypothetical protein n=1 Tax=Streptomyces litmocidini TaxID=67318 RepID=UPI00167EAB76|nr:hypothetical protein [Streptomyces litmocidini]GGU97697.1 hypothetical protein GCM10010275_40210 [Streptomyces litmocidini]